MSWRHVRVLKLALLVLLIASPLSSGDKGLWLGFASAPIQHFELAADRLPAELAIILPDRSSRIGRVAAVSRGERLDDSKALAPASVALWPGASEHGSVDNPGPGYPHGEPRAAFAAPRAPPV